MNELSPLLGLAMLAIFALFCLAAIWMQKRHVHRWKPKNVSNYTLSTTMYGRDIPKGTSTTVLYVCSVCHDSKVKNLKGTWSKEDLT